MTTKPWDISATCSADEIHDVFQKTGFVVLRQFVEREKVASLRRAVSDEFSRLSSMRDHLGIESRKHLDRSELPADPVTAPFRLSPANYSFLTTSPRLIEALKAILGESYLWHYPPMFRQISAKNKKGVLPYHQDYPYNQHYEKLMICFIPLNDCGVDAPALEIIEHHDRKRLAHAGDGTWEFGISQEEIYRTHPPESIHRLVLNTGDMVVFDEVTLHRTHFKEGMTETRWSMDARAVPVSAISAEKRKTRKFVSPEKPTLDSRA